jgi:hypothetical protein
MGAGDKAGEMCRVKHGYTFARAFDELSMIT